METSMFQGKSIRVTRIEDNLAELCFDRQGDSVNKFDQQTLDDLRAATAALAAAKDLKGVLVSSAKDVFIVGADIFEFVELFARPQPELEAWTNQANEIFYALAALPFPSVTAVNGFALGGGFECALATDYRVMSAKAQVGVPEIKLGIIPGFGGTARLSRLIGPEAAVAWITSGAPRSADAAAKAGAVDAVAAPDALRATALDWLKNKSAGWKERRAKRDAAVDASADALKQLYAAARAEVKKTNPHVPAAAGVVDMLERAASLDVRGAQRLEATLFSKVAKSQAADAMVGMFISDQAIKKKSKQYAKVARPVKQVGVLGAGIMGGGIAYQSAVRGTPVIMKDIAQKALDLGMDEARKLLAKQVEGGRMPEAKAQAILGSVRPTLDFSGIDAADLVIEAVVENLEVKKKVLAELEGKLRDDAIIASNTSSLSIDAMAAVLKRPRNMIGMHFFNPVHRMPLVEVVRGRDSSPEAVATGVGMANAMGKTPIVVKDVPGFLVNRILTPYMLGFMQLLRDGVDYQRIDRVMEAFGWPMGPAYLNDVVGMDTSRHAFEVIAAGYPQRMSIDFKTAIDVMVANRRYGQKTGIGFYRYDTDPKGRPRKSVAEDTAGLIASVQGEGMRKAAVEVSDEDIVMRTMLPMIVESAHCLEEGVGESPGEIDMALILGLGLPQHVGGALKYADFLGLPKVVQACERHAALGGVFRPTERMRELAARSGKFYG
jgi:3-hydroxyacyl-CoA dehydrogenase/enoyl-CoA hydratase/3-hydroxybutyryl-CoA epimerase/enoyl-CoA isomerase